MAKEVYNVPQRNEIAINEAKRLMADADVLEAATLPVIAGMRAAADTLIRVSLTNSRRSPRKPGDPVVEEVEPPAPLFTQEEWSRLTLAQRAAFVELRPNDDLVGTV